MSGGVRTIHDLTADERKVIIARRTGWESASATLLARIFRVPVQAINTVVKEG